MMISKPFLHLKGAVFSQKATGFIDSSLGYNTLLLKFICSKLHKSVFLVDGKVL